MLSSPRIEDFVAGDRRVLMGRADQPRHVDDACVVLDIQERMEFGRGWLLAGSDVCKGTGRTPRLVACPG